MERGGGSIDHHQTIQWSIALNLNSKVQYIQMIEVTIASSIVFNSINTTQFTVYE